MDIIVGFCFGFLGFIIFIVCIASIIKEAKKREDKTEPVPKRVNEIKSEFETSVYNAEVIDLSCRVDVLGHKDPETVTSFTAVFKTYDNKEITLNVPQEMYDGLEVGQKGELTLVEGELYSFII